MYGYSSLPLYTSVITLPHGPSIEAYASTLSGIPGYRIVNSGASDGSGRSRITENAEASQAPEATELTVYLGSQARFAFLGTLGRPGYPTPVSVHITDGPMVTATVSYRYFSRMLLPNAKFQERQLRTAIQVRDALASISPEPPVAVARMEATGQEIARSWVSFFLVFMLLYLALRVAIDGWDPIALISGLIGGAIGVGIVALIMRPRGGLTTPVEGFHLL